MNKRLKRRFGDAVQCRFVDVDNCDLEQFPGAAERALAQKARLPLVVIEGRVRYQGMFSPTFIQRDVGALLGEKGEEKARVAPESTRSRGAEVLGRASFSSSVVRAKRGR